MQGWFALNQVIQVTDQLLDAAMRVVLQQIPTDLAVVVPFVPLGQFAAHEQQLLTWMCPHVGVEQSQVGELLPEIASHLADERSFTVHHFVVR